MTAPKVWVMAFDLWAPYPNEGPSWACSSKSSTKLGLANKNECALQGSQVKCLIASKITFNTRAT